MKKLLCVLLTLAMLLSVFAACGAETPASSAAPAAEESAAAPAPDAAPDAPEAPEASAAEASQAEPVLNTVQYPIFDEPTTLSIYWMFHNFLSMFNVTSDIVEKIPTFAAAEEATNVKLDFTLIGEETFGTNLQLLWASGDYRDFICNGEQNYTSGADSAVNEGILLDIVPYLDEYGCDYLRVLNEYSDFRTELTSTEGYIVSFSEFCEYADGGSAIRKDWLDQVGMDYPATMDDVEKVCKAFKEELGVRNAVLWNADLSSFFGWEAFGVCAPGRNDVGWQIADDGETVLCSLREPGYKECLAWMNNAFEKGYVTDDFMNVLNIAFDEYVYANEAGMVMTNVNLLAEGGAERSGQPDYDFRAMPDPMKEAGASNTLAKTSGGVGASAIAISALTEYPEECVAYLNWLFTEDGILVSNYGFEGEAFEYDENGKPQYTDMITNADGMPPFVATFLHTSLVGTPFFNSTERKIASFTIDAERESFGIWATNRTGTNRYQGKMTSEESEEYAGISSDIGTALSEQSLRFVTGERSLDEYDDFVKDLEAMGLDRMQELKQAAYDRYLEANG